MTTLSQIIAIAKTKKSAKYAEFTALHQKLQKTNLLSGISRTYRPLDEENGDHLPPEFTKVQVSADDVIDEAARILTDMFDVIASQDFTNCIAKSDIVVDGETIIADCPVSYMLFLEKQMIDILTFAKALPVLDPSEPSWTISPGTNTWATDAYQTIKTKKTNRNHVRFAGSEHHPPQVDVYAEDVLVGHWTTIKFSGALQASRVRDIIHRVEKLQEAIKFAREKANMQEVQDVKVGGKIFTYLFGRPKHGSS